MNILRNSACLDIIIDDPQERLRRGVGIRVCTFANGSCECADRRHLCSGVEREAAAIIDALRTVCGAP